MPKYLDDAGLAYFLSKCGGKFQAKLISGTNIKTINGQSILGSGNLTISGGATTRLYRHEVRIQCQWAGSSYTFLEMTFYSTSVYPIEDFGDFLDVVFSRGNAVYTIPVTLFNVYNGAVTEVKHLLSYAVSYSNGILGFNYDHNSITDGVGGIQATSSGASMAHYYTDIYSSNVNYVQDDVTEV